TNAHVLWDPDRGQGHENRALTPDTAEIVFEGADDRSAVLACKEVIWQSPSGLHDATLVALNRLVDGIEPLAIAPANTPLVPDDGSGKRGTALTVIAHPQGGALHIGQSGAIGEICVCLVDNCPRGNSRN